MPFYETQFSLFSWLSPKVTTRLVLRLVVRRFMKRAPAFQKIMHKKVILYPTLCSVHRFNFKGLHVSNFKHLLICIYSLRDEL